MSTRHHPPVHAGEAETEEDLISKVNKLEVDELTASKAAIKMTGLQLGKFICRTPQENQAGIQRSQQSVSYAWKDINRGPASNIRQVSAIC